MNLSSENKPYFNLRSSQMWLIFIITAILSGFSAYIELSEFIRIAINKNTGGYPFGGEGPVPWYYKSASLYANAALIYGLLFLAIFLLATWAFIRIKKRTLIFSLIIFVILTMVELLLS